MWQGADARVRLSTGLSFFDRGAKRLLGFGGSDPQLNDLFHDKLSVPQTLDTNLLDKGVRPLKSWGDPALKSISALISDTANAGPALEA